MRGASGLWLGQGLQQLGLLLAAMAVVAACGGAPTTPTSAPTSAPRSAASDPPAGPESATPTSGAAATVPVYYLVDTANQVRLAREFTRVPGAAADPASAAVGLMLTGPAADPDYWTPWNPAVEVLAIDVGDAGIVVDLSDEVRTAEVGAAAAELAVQQLVYTVTAAVQQTLPVVLLIEGEPAGELWGHVVWDGPVSRAPALEVRLLVQLNDPVHGASVPASFTVTGEAAVFEATLPWRILDGSGRVVQEGFTMTEGGQAFAPFEFRVDFAGSAGDYTLQIREEDIAPGEGRPPMVDDKDISIG